jgi:prepilin-type N-terminal cleavage/methylation domain-containing protein
MAERGITRCANDVDARRPVNMQKRRPAGFTLLELLVVVAIVIILMSLLLPAIRSGMEVARRASCGSNMRQLGMAVASYETLHGHYPPAGLVADPYDLRSGQMLSWIVLTLPQFDQQPLFDQFDLERSALDQPLEPQSILPGALYCPSDQARGKYLVDSMLTNGKQFAKGNYAAYNSPFHTDLSKPFPGALSMGREQRLADIRDGITHTILLSEVRVRGNEQDQRGAWALPWTGASLLAFDMHCDPQTASHLSGGEVFSPWSASFGQTQPPNNQGPNVDMLYKCTDIANAQLSKMPCANYGGGQWQFLSAAPRSNHIGGVVICTMGGTIRFLRNDVDEVTMAYLISIHDGVVASLDGTPR